MTNAEKFKEVFGFEVEDAYEDFWVEDFRMTKEQVIEHFEEELSIFGIDCDHGIAMISAIELLRGEAELKHGREQEPCDTCEHSDEIDGNNCYECVKGIRNNYSLKKQEPLTDVLDKIKAEIESCLKALDEIEKSGFNIYHPNEMSGRRLTYKQCLGFIDKYRKESEEI